MKTCTFKKALSLLLAVMMVVSCITVLSVGAAAAKWDDNGWKTDAGKLYEAYVNKAEWIPVGKNSGNGRYETSNEDAEYIYAFAQDSTKIFAFIEVDAPAQDVITLRLDSNRDTLKARTHELVFKWDGANSYKQEKLEYGTDVDDNRSVTNGKFGEQMADYAGTAFTKGNSYEYATIKVNKNYTGENAAPRDAYVLVLQLRKDRLQGNKGSGDFDHVERLGFDIEVNYNNTSILHTANYNADPKVDATDFNIYNVKNDRVERFTLDGKISGNEFWKNNAWQLVTGLNGQLIGNFDQTDIAYDFQVTGDSKNIYIAARLYGESYKDGDKASSFKVYLNIDEENAKRGGYEPTAVLEFVFDGKEYAFVNDSRGDFAHLETATTIAADGHAEIEIKIPYRDLKLVSYDLKDGDPYNYLGVNFEFTAPATYSNEKELATLVARTYGKDADHPAKNCAKNLYFTFNSNYAQYSTENYYVGKFNAKDYGNELAFECGKVSNFNDVDKVVNELSDDYKANKQVIVYRVSDALKSGSWTGGKPGANDKPASFISTYFDYLVYSDGTTLYAIDKGYVELMGNPANRNNYNDQNSGNHVRFWFSDENYWNNNQKFLIVDSAVNFKDTYNNYDGMYVWAHTASWKNVYKKETVLAYTGKNLERTTDSLIIYDSKYGTTTGTNGYGYEVVVDKNGNVTSAGTAGNSTIPDGGFVISGHGKNAEKLEQAYKALRITAKYDVDNKSVAIAACVDSAKFNETVLTYTGMNVERTTDSLIIYDRERGTTTGTNAHGYEVVVDKNGNVISAGTAGNSTIPDGGFVISGHGKNAEKLEQAYKYARSIAAKCVVDNKNVTFAYYDDDGVASAKAKIQYKYLLNKNFYITAVKIPVAELKLTTDTLYYAVTNSFYTKVDGNKNVINDSRCQITSGRFIGCDDGSKYTNSHVAYRYINAKTPANKLARVAYTADENLKKNIIADVYYNVEGIGSYVDTIVNPAIASLSGIAMRGRLNDGIYDNGAINGSDASKNFSVALKNHNGTNAPVYSADAANEISFKLLRNYDIAGFKAVFRRLVSWGIKNPNYVDVYVTNDSGDTQRVGRFYGKANSDDTLVSYDIVLNKAVKGNKITFKFDSEGPFIFATEFQAYAYGDLVVTTNGANVDNGGYDPAMLFAENANGYKVDADYSAKNFQYDENLGAYYAVRVEPTGSGSTLGVYKNGDFAIQYHSNAASDKATAAQKALYNLINSVAFGERVYLYNNAHADANYDLMMQPSDKENNNFFITIGNAYMAKNMTAYDPTVGYVYNFTDLAQIGSGKTSMIIVDSQSVPDSTEFNSVELPADRFTVGGLLGDQTQSLWNYCVAIVEFDDTNSNYYVADYMGAISREKDESDSDWAARQAADNTAKRALSFGTQGFAMISLGNGEFTERLSRMSANDYHLGATTDTVKNPDVVYLYDVDLDALRLSYGNAGALSAKVTFNNKNGNKNNVTTTESWIDLAESSMNDLRARWMKDLASVKSQVSAETYAQLEKQIENNLKYVRAYGLFANKFNSHEYTAGTRANPWVLYDGITSVENLSFNENLFTLYNRKTIFIEGAKQTAGIMLLNSDKNYEAKSEFNGFNRFAALHDNDYTQLNYLNKITYTFYYDFANSYSVPESLRVYTSANYSFMNHTKPNYEVTLTDKTSDDGKAYPTEGAGTWTITIDMPLVKSTAVYTEFDFTSKQLAVVEINEKCVIADLMGSEVANYKPYQRSCDVTVGGNKYYAVTIDAKADSIVINHDHSKHNASGHTCTTECYAEVTNSFYGNTFVDLSKTPYLSINMEVPANLTDTRFELVVWYNGASRIINLSNIIAREAKDGKVEYFFDFADFCKNTYGMTLKDGVLLQLKEWSFETKFIDNTAGTVKINALKFVGAEDTKSEIKAGSDLKLDADKKLLILDKQYKEDALRQEFNGEIIVEGTAKSGFVGTGAKVTVNGDVYTVVLYGDLNGDGAINPADYIIVRKALLKTVELDEIQTVAAIGPKASKVTATTYIQIRQHILGTYNFFAGEKVAQ